MSDANLKTRSSTGKPKSLVGTTALVRVGGESVAFECITDMRFQVKIRSLDLRFVDRVPRLAWRRALIEQGKITEVSE